MDEINEINDLHQFPAPIENEIVLCEIKGRLHYSSLSENSDNVYTMVPALKKHKQIHITREQLHTTKHTDDGSKHLFLPVAVPLIKEVVQTYYEQGFTQALKLTKNRNSLILSNIASVLLNLILRANQLRAYIYPNIHDSPEASKSLMTTLNRTRQWLSSPIRTFAWHPNSLIIAVASLDDCVRIFPADQSSNQLVPLLKCKQQKNITCISWRPNSNCCLAVACERLIIIWDIDLSSVITRPSTNNCMILSRAYHAPIVDIAWCPRGVILASVAALDTRIHMWNPEFDAVDILKRASGTGNYLVRWAPNNSKVFTSTNTLVFRVWECKTWTAERWHIDSGYVQTACWSPCSSVLLFITSSEPFIYSLSFVSYDQVFENESSNSPNLAERIYDLTKIETDDGVLVGGEVRDMQWDPRGNHVAILFNTTNCVAVFMVSVQPRLHLLPCCLVTGLPHEVPCSIAFQQNFSEGACLTVAWSSGRIQYFPVVYGDDSNISNFRRLY